MRDPACARRKNESLTRQSREGSVLDNLQVHKTERARWSIAFHKAIVEIDERDDYPDTPEEVAKAYWDARTAKNFEEMAVLWPGSATWNESLKDEKPVQYVFGRAKGDPVSGHVLVPYAAKEYYEKHGTHNLKMRLTTEKSSKGRYYIVSGN